MVSLCRPWHHGLLALLLQLASISPRMSTTTFTIINDCSYTVWPGILSNAGVAPLENGGFVLESGKSATISAPAGWSGRFWGRAGCDFSSAGTGTCASGDCGGKLECSGTGATPPATLIEFSLQGPTSPRDYYDVSLVDGFNLPVSAIPKHSSNGTCSIAGCSSNINSDCPKELQVTDGGQVVSCKSACLAFSTDQFCCAGSYGNPSTCQPSNYSKLFKAACPNAYSYAYDDPTSIFTCSGASYDIAFCPSSASEGWTKARARRGAAFVVAMGAMVAWRLCR